VRWGSDRRKTQRRKAAKAQRMNPSADLTIHRQSGFAEKNKKRRKNRSAQPFASIGVHSRFNPSVLKIPTESCSR
jgi:hypothetical protein